MAALLDNLDTGREARWAACGASATSTTTTCATCWPNCGSRRQSRALLGGEPTSPVAPDVIAEPGRPACRTEWLATCCHGCFRSISAITPASQACLAATPTRPSWPIASARPTVARSLDQRARPSSWSPARSCASRTASSPSASMTAPSAEPEDRRRGDRQGTSPSSAGSPAAHNTPRGAFEMKFFFTGFHRFVGRRRGPLGRARHKIRQMIDAEREEAGGQSDDRIVELLKAAGIDIACRTAKYREAMRVIHLSVDRRLRLRKPADAGSTPVSPDTRFTGSRLTPMMQVQVSGKHVDVGQAPVRGSPKISSPQSANIFERGR